MAFLRALFISIILTSAGHAAADPEEDAAIIVDALVSEDLYVAVFEALADLMGGNIRNEFSKAGEEVSDDAIETVVSMMTEDMSSMMATDMRQGMIDVYVEMFSSETLAAYRTFLETDAGREVAALTPELTREGQKLGEGIGADIGVRAANRMQERIKAGQFPEGTLRTTQSELRALFADE